MQALHRVQLARHGANVLFVSRIDAVAPLTGLRVEILPTGERSAHQEVVFDEVERAFDTPFAIGVTDLMSHETEPHAFAERSHFRHRPHLLAAAAQHDRMCVVDRHLLR